MSSSYIPPQYHDPQQCIYFAGSQFTNKGTTYRRNMKVVAGILAEEFSTG